MTHGVNQYIYELAAIFLFFIMANQCQYFVSVDTRKTRDQIFGTVGNLKFVCTGRERFCFELSGNLN